MKALKTIRDRGFKVTLKGDGFEIVPASELTSNQREFLKAHRAEIIQELEAEAMPLAACDRQKLLDYLAAIDEHDPEMIDEMLTECAKDANKLAEALSWADKVLGIAQAVDDRHYCRECIFLIGGQCRKQGFRPIDDIPRRCSDFEASGVVVLIPEQDCEPAAPMITCKSCDHFQSYYDHGGGAGSCAAGVMPFGACWWVDTHHQCEDYLIKAEV